ncbi:MAG: ABC transporter ATP-binding protein [Clostridiales bacterium]|nr:ABC transporter ATP-binding protein [Clostridiales bacterium]
MVKVTGLCAGYDNREVLHDVSLEFLPGRVTTIIGENGCGKSTLLKAIAGQIDISGGNVMIGDRDRTKMNIREVARTVAYLAQSKTTPDITVGRMVLHGRFPYLTYPRRYSKRDLEIAQEAMKIMGITELRDMTLSQLSGGMRQKVYIAMALAQQSPVILMDEPTTFLDITQQLLFTESARDLAKDNKTVIMVLHDLLLALKWSDEIVVMHEGKAIFNGTPEEVIASGTIEKVYGVVVKSVSEKDKVNYYYDY